MNLTRIQAARALVLDIQRWTVEQHPLNREHYTPARPCPGDLLAADLEWQEAARELPWRESPPLTTFEPGALALWGMQPTLGWTVPVRLVRPHIRQKRVWWAERLDDPQPKLKKGQTPVSRLYPVTPESLRTWGPPV